MCLPVTRLEYSISFRTADREEGGWEVVQVGGGQQRKKETDRKGLCAFQVLQFAGWPSPRMTHQARPGQSLIASHGLN